MKDQAALSYEPRTGQPQDLCRGWWSHPNTCQRDQTSGSIGLEKISAISLHLKTFKHMFAIQNSDQQWEKQTTLSSQCQKSREKLQLSMPWSHMMSVGKKVKEINNLSILLSSSFHNGYHNYQCNVLGFHLMDRTDKCVCLFYMLWCIHLMCERQIYLKLVGVFVAIHF